MLCPQGVKCNSSPFDCELHIVTSWQGVQSKKQGGSNYVEKSETLLQPGNQSQHQQ